MPLPKKNCDFLNRLALKNVFKIFYLPAKNKFDFSGKLCGREKK